ncbi:MAG: tetratricopeptide repeat protein [Limisphaerales bacterium]
MLYWWARGVKANRRRAFEWFWKAAWLGDAEANTYVGMCFHDGVGVKKNFKRAFKHYRLASEKDPYAQYCLGLCYRNGEGIKKNKRLVFSWLKKAAANGEKDAVQALKKI